ncbi:hypothetical protein F5Y14DRAFT_457747 [Nemania sp. NC0429]|nr:hypothetical protein F5Y14DRAFT_457747 [Nemania sp. NC0429]
MAPALFDVPPASSVASGRIGQIIQDVNIDAADPKHGFPDNFTLPEWPETEGTLIASLIESNRRLYDRFLNNCFCRGMAQGLLPLGAYEEFAKQDYLYLLDSIRFKALRFAKCNFRGDLNDMKTESDKIARAVGYAQDWKQTCISKLRIPESEMDNIQPSVAEMAYSGFLQNQTSQDDWFSLYVIMIPSKDTVFYETWIQPNLGDASAQKLSRFLEANRGANTSPVNKDRWNELFRNALKLELELFNSSLLRGIIPWLPRRPTAEDRNMALQSLMLGE